MFMRRSAYVPSKGSVAPIPRIGLATGLGASSSTILCETLAAASPAVLILAPPHSEAHRQSTASAAISTLRTTVFLANAS